MTVICQTSAGCYDGSLSSLWFTRQEVDNGLSQNHVREAAFTSNYTEHVQSLVLWTAFSDSQY